MTDTTTKPRRLFEELRTDPKKVAEGVWITHPDSKDRLRVRRRFSEHHRDAYKAAAAEYASRHGADAAKSPEGDAAIDATAMARAIIVDWKLADDPDRAYDQAEMEAVLVDPAFLEVRLWIYGMCESRAPFRHDDAPVTP